MKCYILKIGEIKFTFHQLYCLTPATDSSDGSRAMTAYVTQGVGNC